MLINELTSGPAYWIVALVVINFIAFAAFGLDKSCAENGHRRVSEATLLNLALIGGVGGAYAGRALFRHKTRKQPFSAHLQTIATLHLCAGAFALVYFW